MFLHVGNGRNIRQKDIIGIFDMDNATVSQITRKYLSCEQKIGNVETVADEIPKSFILYLDGEKMCICLSPLSTSALQGRMNLN